MPKLLQLFVIVAIGIIVAVADALIKKASVTGTFWATLRHPLMFWVWLFYIAQTLLAIFIYLWKWDLGISVNAFIVFYSIAGVILGYFVFKETFSIIQYVGIGLAILGVVLMNK